MRRSIIAGLLCLALFFTAYVGGMVTAAPRSIIQVSTRGVGCVNVNQPRISFCGGGDEGGGGRPGLTSLNGTGL